MDTAAEASPVSPTQLRSVMAQFATGVLVLTVGGDHVHGMTANAFASVSLEPPLVLCCVSRTAIMHQAVTAAGHFGASVLDAGQEAQARHFADRNRPRGAAQFRVGNWLAGPRTGAPLMSDCLAWLECELLDAHEAGDHSVFIGRVLGAGQGAGTGGLVFFDGSFRPILPE